MKRHFTSNNPTDNDEEGGDAQGNLDAGANRHTHGQVHFVAKSNDYSSNMLRRVSDNGDENQTNKGLADVCSLDKRVDASNQVIGTDGDQDGNDDKNDGGSNGTHRGLLGLLTVGANRIFGVEKVAVRAKLEDEVESIQDEENDSSSAGQNQNAMVPVAVARILLVEDAIELGQCQIPLVTPKNDNGNIPQRESRERQTTEP